MPKNIVFCADGTWNGPGTQSGGEGTPAATNVFKLFTNLDGNDSAATLCLADEQERSLADPAGNAVQIAKYLHGVGDSGNFLVRILGGTMGAGIITRIVRGYTFVSRNYRAGDRVFLVGFSRGAYTARALAGWIASKGLLDATQVNLEDREAAYRLATAVWYDYRKNILETQGLRGRLEALALDLPAFLSAAPTTRLVRAPIEAVAVWDTVGSLGIPAYNLQTDDRIDIFQFADRALSPAVRNGIHAVSLDEQRGDFEPTLWDADPRVVQRLFAGAHADVGGGYAIADKESSLSDIALDWLSAKLKDLGVRFRATPNFATQPDPLGTAHQPWQSPPWTFLERKPRVFPNGLEVDPSIQVRMQAPTVIANPGRDPEHYAPNNLPAA